MRELELYTRTETGYEPSNQKAIDQWRKDAVGAEKWLERKSDRNPRHHNKFFKFLRLVVNNSDQFDSAEQLRFCIMAALQRGTWIKPGRANKAVFIPDSIAFSKMNQAEFDEFYRDAVAVVDKYFLPSCSEELMQEIMRF